MYFYEVDTQRIQQPDQEIEFSSTPESFLMPYPNHYILPPQMGPLP